MYFWLVVVISIGCSVASLVLETNGYTLGNLIKPPSTEPFFNGEILSQMSFILSFLLFFRSNKAHDRWSTAKAHLQRMHFAASEFERHVARISGSPKAVIESTRHIQLLLAVAHHAIARTQVSRGPVDMLATVSEMDVLESEPVESWVPLVAKWLTADTGSALIEKPATPVEWIERLDADVAMLCSAFNGANDIARGCIPRSYTRMLDAILYIYVTLTPLSIGPVYGWLSPICSGAYTMALLGINQISIEMEQPFEGGDFHDLNVLDFAITYTYKHPHSHV